MQKKWLTAVFFSYSSMLFAQSPLVPELGTGELVPVPQELLDDTYRIGDEWGKKRVEQEDLNKSEQLRLIATATGMLNGATSFYIGEYAGYHVVASNNHVCPTSCLGKSVRFPILNFSAKVTKFFGTWTDIDMSLMAIELTDEQAAKLQAVARPFDFTDSIEPGEELITVGFGRGDNPNGYLVANADSDCKVFSAKDEFRFMRDPDELNPGKYKVWSFAHGCDVSHGDSGSAIVDRHTGNVIGLLWTGRIPKLEKVQSSAYLDEMLATHSEEIWQELSYAVPAKKIQEFLRGVIAGGTLDAESKTAIEAVIH